MKTAKGVFTLTVLVIFGMVAASLNILAKLIGMTYNEINIIVYYLIIPLSWCMMLDYIIGLPITTPIWILLWIYIIWSKRKFFKDWCDAAFKLSVDFLLKFKRIGWKGVIVALIVITGTYLGSATIANIMLLLTGMI